MQANISWNEDSKVVDFDGSESGLFKEVGKCMLNMNIPNRIHVTCNGETAVVFIGKRGTQMINGNKVPAMHIDQMKSYNTIRLTPSKYDVCEMRCINPDGNNYKKYYFEPAGNVFYGRYGSIDVPKDQCRRTQVPYDNWLWEVLKAEKISKQYVDVTAITNAGNATSVAVAKKKPKTPSSVNATLYAQLMAYAHHVVQTTLAAPEAITEAQCKQARKYWNEMQKKKTVKSFNKWLCKLMMISPRKRDPLAGDTVNQYLAITTSDFPRIIDFEENLLLSMEAVVTGNPKNVKVDEDSFRQFGIHVWVATDTQKKEVMSYLEPSLQTKVKQIYRVKPETQEERFNAYRKKNHIKKIRKLWHGSVNGSWASIIKEGLVIKPTISNGRMFGNGIYFAPSAHKSWGYTSYHGTRWANGNQNTAFMGLYATAYGKPWKVNGSGHYSQSQVKAAGYDCVHAEAARTGLRADEIIFYDKDAICLNYIVEFC